MPAVSLASPLLAPASLSLSDLPRMGRLYEAFRLPLHFVLVEPDAYAARWKGGGFLSPFHAYERGRFRSLLRGGSERILSRGFTRERLDAYGWYSLPTKKGLSDPRYQERCAHILETWPGRVPRELPCALRAGSVAELEMIISLVRGEAAHILESLDQALPRNITHSLSYYKEREEVRVRGKSVALPPMPNEASRRLLLGHGFSPQGEMRGETLHEGDLSLTPFWQRVLKRR